MLVSQSKLAWLTPNLGILWISVSSFWLCGSIVANPIIYRLVPSPSRYEIRQFYILSSTAKDLAVIFFPVVYSNCHQDFLPFFYLALLNFHKTCSNIYRFRSLSSKFSLSTSTWLTLSYDDLQDTSQQSFTAFTRAVIYNGLQITSACNGDW